MFSTYYFLVPGVNKERIKNDKTHLKPDSLKSVGLLQVLRRGGSDGVLVIT